MNVDIAFRMFTVWIYWCSLVGDYKENKKEEKNGDSGEATIQQTLECCSADKAHTVSINILPPPKPTCKTSFVQKG